jgi:hypothetical protein
MSFQPEGFPQALTQLARDRFNDSVTGWEVATLRHWPGFVHAVNQRSADMHQTLPKARV